MAGWLSLLSTGVMGERGYSFTMLPSDLRLKQWALGAQLFRRDLSSKFLLV